MAESREQKRSRLATEALQQAKDSTHCQHQRDSRGRDETSGREFCADCGAFADGGPQWDPSWGPEPADGWTPQKL